MNVTLWTGIALIVLGLAGVFATGAATAAIPAIFGVLLALIGLRAGRSAGWPAAVVATLGLLAPLGNIARVVAEGALVMNAAVLANIGMAVICGLYLVHWLYTRRTERQGRAVK